MPSNDQFGRPVAEGDTVIIKGEVTKVLDNPGYINCTVKLAQPMPPSGAETTIQCNTAQLENSSSGKDAGAEKSTSQSAPPPPAHGGAKK